MGGAATTAHIATPPRVASLRCQLPAGVSVIGREEARLTWQITSPRPDALQEAYEVQWTHDPGFEHDVRTRGEIHDARQVGVLAPGGQFRTREVRFYRVRVRVDGCWSERSEPIRIEAGLLRAADWQARAISLAADPGQSRQAPAPVLRREFDIDGEVRRALLHVTSLGVHQVNLNGERVGNHRLSPGWTSYHRRLLTDTHEVTALLRPGRNAVGAILGDGWYRGRLGWDPGDDRCRYGRAVALVLQLEAELADGRRLVIASDGEWRAATAEIRRADLYDGVLVDLRESRPGWDQPGYDNSSWTPVAFVPFDPAVLEPRTSPPVREIAVRPATMTRARPGVLRLDGGQNLAGYVRLRVRGKRGDRVLVRHAEVLRPDGGLYTDGLRSARAIDEYILSSETEAVLEPSFTFHGFRYAEVETTAEVVSAGTRGPQQRPPAEEHVCLLRSAAGQAPRERRMVVALELRLDPERLPAA